MMSVLTPEQQAIYRANLASDRSLGTCAATATDSVSQQRPAQSSGAELTIAEIVSQSGGQYDSNPEDFDILLNAVKQTGLVDALADQAANLTVFAPTDAAFLKLSRFFGYQGNDEAAVLDVINQEFARMNQLDVARGGSNPNAFNLRDVLLYHVSSGAKNLDALQQLPGDKSMATLLNWGDRPVNANRIAYVNGNLIDAAPNLMAPRIQENLQDIAARNGVIQGIDRVLFPYFLSGQFPVLPRTQPQAGQPTTIASVLAQSGSGFDDNRQDFDILNKLLATAEIADLFAAPNANLTLFAPTDAAFIEFAEFTLGGVDQGTEDAESKAYRQIINVIQQVDQVTTQEVFVGGDAVPLLQKVLQYHASAGAKTAEEIQAASSIPTLLNGAAITPQQGDRAPSSDLTNSQFQLGDIYVQTTNGVIQSIDNVLVPSIKQAR
ncbi:fasciclin domain-containing protein [Microcoleus sp. FACHB-1515]|uniref:fasciclin domain-containing protein n=1 Tax=Cyanophyceae TaxID=3028117 RepID=UPI00168595DA|nr:fasciclin domain-containing protein [Microcoleus sp. FACHB-1515]MBD2091830.1 fasciclin domain-containing protein [Microcoleus sp. FACHB-1515]